MKITIPGLCLLAVLCFAGSGTVQGGSTEGVVTANKLNIRVKPGKYTSVGMLKRGAKVIIHNEKNGWYRIALPSDVAVWVSARFVKDGKITGKVYLRSGPGINYNPYGFAHAGQQITILDNKRTDWLKIAPLPDMSAWVFAKYIKVTKTEPAKSTPYTKEIKTTGSPDELAYVDETPQNVTRDGYILKTASTHGITHALCRYEYGKYQPVCYLYGNKTELDKVVEKRVMIKGTQRWVKNWRLPVVKISEIIRNNKKSVK